MAYSELNIFLRMASGDHLGYGYSSSSQCKNTRRIGKPSKMTYCTTFSDYYLDKLGFPRWHLAAIFNMVILRPPNANAKLPAEMDTAYQKTSKTTYCTTFCDNYSKS